MSIVGRRLWTDEDTVMLRKLHSEGLLDDEIGGQMGRHQRTISRYRSALGLPCLRFTPHGRARFRSSLDRAIEHRREGDPTSSQIEARSRQAREERARAKRAEENREHQCHSRKLRNEHLKRERSNRLFAATIAERLARSMEAL